MHIRGKAGPQTAGAARQGINDFTRGFTQLPEMAGQYFDYDGPCPSWNDARVHRYQFTLYTLDIKRFQVDAPL